jgi:hypothetical protein
MDAPREEREGRGADPIPMGYLLFRAFLSIPFLESGSRKPKIPLSDTGYGCILIRVLSSGSKKGEEIREPREQREGL